MKVLTKIGGLSVPLKPPLAMGYNQGHSQPQTDAKAHTFQFNTLAI